MLVQGVAASKPKKPKSNGQKCEWGSDLEIAPKIKINPSRLRPLSDNQIGNRPNEREIPGKRQGLIFT